jgi:NADH-quinone oxidoreductase subunit F
MERPLTMHFRPDGQPPTLQEYEHKGGYEAARKALREMTRAEIVKVVSDSCLRGRG